jgi:hypothetical protein
VTRRTALSAVALAGLALPLLLGPEAAAVHADEGTYLTPFREDGARYDRASNTFSGGRRAGVATDANGCVTGPAKTGAPKENPRAYDCVPAGASLVHLPDGRVLLWDALEGEERVAGTDTGLTDGAEYLVNDQSRVLDLRRGRPSYRAPSPVDGGARQAQHPDDLPLGPFSSAHYSYDNGSLFCSDQVLLANGDVLVAGGTDYYTEPYVPVVDKGVIELEGLKNTRFFDGDSNHWRQGPAMAHGRWYPSLVTLPDGKVLVASGVTKLIKPVYPTSPTDSGRNVTQTETLTVGSAKPQWVVNPSSADRSLPLYPRLHLLPNGHVYYDAAGQAFNPAGEAYDEALWTVAATYDPKRKAWTDLGVPGADPEYLAANPQALPFVGFRGSTFSAALPLRPTAVKGGVPSYASSSYLTAGGVLGTSPGSYVAVANSRITTVDTAGSTASMRTIGADDLGTARWYGTATPLPNGQVFVTSGANVDEVVAPASESPIRTDELFTPRLDGSGAYTGGSWRPAGSQARKRTYHNNAILLADGSVLIGGHAPILAGYFQTTDTPDLPVREGTNNHHDPSFQVWLPPYFNEPGRPVVSGVRAAARTLTVATAQARSIAQVVLMRNTAQTHLVDADARTVVLPVLSRTASTVTVGLPATTAVLPGGPYLLFANASRSGELSGRDPAALLPSRGVQLFVTGTSTPSVLVPKAARGTFGRSTGSTSSAAAPRTARAARPGTTVAAAPAPGRSTTAPVLELAADRRRAPGSAPVVLALVLALGTAAGLARQRRRTGS